MRLWVDVHNDNDKRHLLINYDESINEDLLTEAYDTIATQDQNLTGSEAFNTHYRNEDKRVWDEYDIKAIEATIKCLQLGRKDLAKILIGEFRLKVKLKDDPFDKTAISTLENLIKSINNRKKMKRLRDKSEAQAVVTWANMRVNIHVGLGIMPEFDCTVDVYRSYESSLKRKTELESQK